MARWTSFVIIAAVPFMVTLFVAILWRVTSPKSGLTSGWREAQDDTGHPDR
ncbi:hypothetical protein CYD53_10542 [Bosea psychrotolerans]|uniref:Uncharacterized protein n=1 Tax=Bosea psychrotolerans TaxID=1871628 RepID=A0A2S4MD59_9HYPH|nr:hypothetical protein CYD53_10542 [Bosea psychrotolerans]